MWKKPSGKWIGRVLIATGLAVALWPLVADRAHAILGGFFRGLIGLVGGLALVVSGGVIDVSKLTQNKLLNDLHEEVSRQMENIRDVEKQVRDRIARLNFEHRNKQDFAEAQQRRNFQLPERPSARERLQETRQAAQDFFQLSPAEVAQNLNVRGEVACQELPASQAALEEMQRQIAADGFTLDELDRAFYLAESEADLRTLSAAQQLRFAQSLYLARLLRLAQLRVQALEYLCQQYHMEQEQNVKHKWLGGQ